MTDLQLQEYVEQLSAQYFGWPFTHKAYFNTRLRTTGGRYMLQTHDIQINKKLYEHFGLDELKGIILHELCHYHLHLQGKGYKHRDTDFRALLQKVGAPRFCSSIEKVNVRQKVTYRYSCAKCGLIYIRRKRLNVTSYCCSKCNGEIILCKD